MTQAIAEPYGEPAPDADSAERADIFGSRRSPSVEHVLSGSGRGGGLVPSGAVVAEFFGLHKDYLAEGIDWADVVTTGPSRTFAEHIDAAEQRWDPSLVPVLTGRHVVLGLALDAGVGWPLLQSGVIASILDLWRPGLGTVAEPHRVVWDVLSESGRALVDDQPLLAGAFGAPAEWSRVVPAEVALLCWSPDGDRLAVLAGRSVYRADPDQSPRLINEVGAGVISLAWGDGGVVTLVLESGMARIVRVAEGSVVGELDTVTGGRLAGGGSCAWLERPDGIQRWSPPQQPDSGRLAPMGRVLAVDTVGRRGLVGTETGSVLVGEPGDIVAGGAASSAPEWPSDAGPMIGWGPKVVGPCGLVRVGERTAVAMPAEHGGVVIDGFPFPAMARIATGPGAIGAIAVDASGTRLAVAQGDRVSVWILARERPAADGIPRYVSDRSAGTDLLDADRDARALAALIAAGDLRPPLTIGLFGDWGSGKSFLLSRIEHMLAGFAEAKTADGYVDHLTVVDFNAWHYAETNLWASLVDRVLRAIGPQQSPGSPPEVEEANSRLQQAEKKAGCAGAEVDKAGKALDEARRKLAKRRRKAWWFVAAVLVVAAVAVVAAVVGGVGRFVAASGAALALVAAAGAALGQVKRSTQQAKELVDAGRTGVGTLSRLAGRPEELAVRITAADLARSMAGLEAATAETARLKDEADRVRTFAEQEPLGTLLDRLSDVTEYREQLSLVARTRERFASIDEAVTEARRNRAGGQQGDLPLDRIVIVIDDLDRCPAKKVVTVLEAVHLLFDFEMFVVILAVDTRWLDQSLRIRYRQLLGRGNGATPSDYLEKIIQIPVQLRPLGEKMIQKLIAGLTEDAIQLPTDPRAVPPSHEPSVEPASSSATDGALRAERPRAARPPLPPDVLKISPGEAAALSAVAPLVGATPRRVKRFVNTYRILKARVPDPGEFDHGGGGVGDHEVVAFLLAVLIGHPIVARYLVPALAVAKRDATLLSVVSTPDPMSQWTGSDGPMSGEGTLADVRDWLRRHPRYEQAPAGRFAKWAPEAARFSFTYPKASV